MVIKFKKAKVEKYDLTDISFLFNIHTSKILFTGKTHETYFSTKQSKM